MGKIDLDKVMAAYCIAKNEECYEHVANALRKSKKDFVYGYSFFTTETVDSKVIRLMEKMHAKCMKG